MRIEIVAPFTTTLHHMAIQKCFRVVQSQCLWVKTQINDNVFFYDFLTDTSTIFLFVSKFTMTDRTCICVCTFFVCVVTFIRYISTSNSYNYLCNDKLRHIFPLFRCKNRARLWSFGATMLIKLCPPFQTKPPSISPASVLNILYLWYMFATFTLLEGP